MLKHFLLFILFFCLTVGKVSSQNTHKIYVTVLPGSNTLNIQQDIVFHNQTNDTLNSVYLYDWNNAYASKKSALAKRFAQEFDKSLHLARKEERGSTNIINVTDKNFNYLHWERTKAEDLLKIQLNYPIYPQQYYNFKLSYTVKLPNSKFTRYGYTDNGDFNLRYWYVAPAVYDNEWTLFSNKNLDDLYTLNSNYEIHITYPKEYTLISDLDQIQSKEENGLVQTVIYGADRSDIKLFLQKTNKFSVYQSNKLTLISDFEGKEYNEIAKANSVDKVVGFIHDRLGKYPHRNLLVTDDEYRKNPLYGLNQLPSFLRPFPEEFQFELKLLKTTLNNYIENTLFINPRQNKWVADAIQTYLMMEYVNEYYPKMKLLGSLSRIWGVRSFHLAQMDFNDQYAFLYMLMARKNLDQPLTEQRDSLIKFNEKIANKYKAGLGLEYLGNYLSKGYIDQKIKEYYNTSVSSKNKAPNFETILREGAEKDIDWFFTNYVQSRNRIDYKIKSYRKDEDSIWVTIKNKRGTNAPITLFGIDKNDSIVSKQWLFDIENEKTFSIQNNETKKLVLNYDKIIPEFNQRDNWKSTNGFFSSNKRLKFQFFKDAEDPYFNQVFYVPIASYNLYDGFTPGMRLYNKAFLNRPFIYDLRPSYGLREKALVGSGSLLYRKYIEEGNLYIVNYYLNGTTFHYAPGLRYSTITPSVSFGFRTDDLRSNEREFLTLRYVNVIRDQVPEIKTDPDYSVFNARYNYSNDGIIDYLSWFADAQVSSKFSKLSLNMEYRKLYQNNMQLNLRFFAGKFIYNETNSNFFSYALDRATDYLFDYDYLGRSEDSGLFSQQLIISEGGFKSKLNNPYANNWMVTTNASLNIWRWVELYGDMGMIKNSQENARFVYDSGVRLNLVTGYFELYFPLYSNNGWEIGQPRYDQKIRFVVTLSPRTLIGLFTRKWF